MYSEEEKEHKIVIKKDGIITDTICAYPNAGVKVIDFIFISDLEICYIIDANESMIYYKKGALNNEGHWRTHTSYQIGYDPLSHQLMFKDWVRPTYDLLAVDEIEKTQGDKKTIIDLEKMEREGRVMHPKFKN